MNDSIAENREGKSIISKNEEESQQPNTATMQRLRLMEISAPLTNTSRGGDHFYNLDDTIPDISNTDCNS